MARPQGNITSQRHFCCDISQWICYLLSKETSSSLSICRHSCRNTHSLLSPQTFHLNTTRVFNVFFITLIFFSALGDCARQALRYNYPRDEVNFSLSQGICYSITFLCFWLFYLGLDKITARKPAFQANVPSFILLMNVLLVVPLASCHSDSPSEFSFLASKRCSPLFSIKTNLTSIEEGN